MTLSAPRGLLDLPPPGWPWFSVFRGALLQLKAC
jgi:hypothetical protein